MNFSFVLLQLGIGIASSRYALAGESCRHDNRDTVGDRKPTETIAPKYWSVGASTDTPIDSQINPVQPEEAPIHVRATYQHLTDVLRTFNVNNIFGFRERSCLPHSGHRRTG